MWKSIPILQSRKLMLEVSGSPKNVEKRHFNHTSAMALYLPHTILVCVCAFTFHFHALEREMATHSGVLAWRIPRGGGPVGEGKTRRGTATPGHRPQRPAWGRGESDTTERLHFHFSLSCIGEGNGSTLQCSCLENPRDRGAWWAAVHGVSQSRTRLKRLSSSSSSSSGNYSFC